MEDSRVPAAPVAFGVCECDEKAKSVPIVLKIQFLIDQKEKLLERARGRIGWEKLIEELWDSSCGFRSEPPVFCHRCNLPESEQLTETRSEKQLLACQVEAIKFFLVNNRPRRSPRRARSPKTEKLEKSFVQKAPKTSRCCECDVEEDQLESMWESIVCLIKQKDKLEESARGTGQWLVVQEDLQRTACDTDLKVGNTCRLCHLPQLDIVTHAKEEKHLIATQINVLKFHLVNNRPRRSPRRLPSPKQGSIESADGHEPPSEKERCECNDKDKLTVLRERIELLNSQSKKLERRAKDRVGWEKVQSEMEVISSAFSSQRPSICCLCNIPETDSVADARIEKRILFAQVEAVKYFLVNNRPRRTPRRVHSPKKAENKVDSQTTNAADVGKTQAGVAAAIPEKTSKPQVAATTDATADTLKAQVGAEALLMFATSSSTGFSTAVRKSEAADKDPASPEESRAQGVTDPEGTCGFPCHCDVSSAASTLKAKYKDLRKQQKQLKEEARDRVQRTSLEDLEIYHPADVAAATPSNCAECKGQEAPKITRLRYKIQNACNKIEIFKFILLKNPTPVPTETQVEQPANRSPAASEQTKTRPSMLTKEEKEDAGLVKCSINIVGAAMTPPTNRVSTVVGDEAMGDAPPKIAESKAHPLSEDGEMAPFTFNDEFEMDKAPQWMPETPPRSEQPVLISDEASEMVPFTFQHEFEMDEAPQWMPDTPPEDEVHEPSVASPMKEGEQWLETQTYGQPEKASEAHEAITMRESVARALICLSQKKSDDILPAEFTVETAMHVDQEENDDIEKLEQEIEEILSKPEGMEMMAIEVERSESGTGAILEEQGALSLEELLKEDGLELKGKVETGRACGEKGRIGSAFTDRGPIPPPAGLCSPRKSISALIDAATLWSLRDKCETGALSSAPESITSRIEAATKSLAADSGAGSDADTTLESKDSLVIATVSENLSDSRKSREVHAPPKAALLHDSTVEERPEACDGAIKSTTDYGFITTKASTIGQPWTPPPGKPKASTSTVAKDKEAAPLSNKGSPFANSSGLHGAVSVQESAVEQPELCDLAGTPTQSFRSASPKTKQAVEAIQSEQAIANKVGNLILGVIKPNINQAFPEQEVMHETPSKDKGSSNADRIDSEDITIQEPRQETVQVLFPSDGMAKLATESTKMNGRTSPEKQHSLVKSISESVVSENTDSAHARLELEPLHVQGNRNSIANRIDNEDITIQETRQQTVQVSSPSEGVAKLATESTKMNGMTNPEKPHPLVESVLKNVVSENTESAHARLESPHVQGNRSLIGPLPPPTSPCSMEETDSVTANVALQLFNVRSAQANVLQVMGKKAAYGETHIKYSDPNVRAPYEASAGQLESNSAMKCQKDFARKLTKGDSRSELTAVVTHMHEDVESLRRMFDQETSERVRDHSKLRMLAPKYMFLRTEVSQRIDEIAPLESAVERDREALLSRKQDDKCRTKILRDQYRYWHDESHRLYKALENNQLVVKRQATRTKSMESELGYAATVEAELVQKGARVSELCGGAQNTSFTVQCLRKALAKKHAQVQTLTRDLENLKVRKDDFIKRRNVRIRFIQDILKVRIKEKMAFREAYTGSKVLARQRTKEAKELMLKLSDAERTNEELRRRIGQLELRLAASKRRDKRSIRSKAPSFCLFSEHTVTGENTAGFEQPRFNTNFQEFLLALEETQKQLIESHSSSSVLLLATLVEQAKRYSVIQHSECNEQERKSFCEAVTKAAQRGERREKAMQEKILEQAHYRQKAEDQESRVKSLALHMVDDVVDRLSHLVRLASPPSSCPEDTHDKMRQLKTDLTSIFQFFPQAGEPEPPLQSAVASTVSNIFLEVEEVFVEFSEACQENAGRVQMLYHELAAAQRQKENMWAVVQDVSCVKQNIGSALSAISAAVQEQCQVKYVSRLFRDLAIVFATWYDQNEQSPAQPQEREKREASLKTNVVKIMAQFEDTCWPDVIDPEERTSAAGVTPRMSNRIPKVSYECSTQSSMPTCWVPDIYEAEVAISCSDDGVQGWQTEVVDVTPENAAGVYFGTAAEALVSSPGLIASEELPLIENSLDDICLEDDGVVDESDIVDTLGAMSTSVERSKACEQASIVYSCRGYPESPSAILREIESLLDDSTEQDSCPTTATAVEAANNSTCDVAPSSLLASNEISSQEPIPESAVPDATIPAHQARDLAVNTPQELENAAPEHLHADTKDQETPKRQMVPKNENQDKLAMTSEDILSAAECHQSRCNSDQLRPPSQVKIDQELMGMSSEDILSTNQRLVQNISDLKRRSVELEDALQAQCITHSEAIRFMKEAHQQQIEGISTLFKTLLDTYKSGDSSGTSSSQLIAPGLKQIYEAELGQGRKEAQRTTQRPLPCLLQDSIETGVKKNQQPTKSGVLEGSHSNQGVMQRPANVDAKPDTQNDEILPNRQSIAPIAVQSTTQRQLFPAAHLVPEMANEKSIFPFPTTKEKAFETSRLLAPGFSRGTHCVSRSFPSAHDPVKSQSQRKGYLPSKIPRLFLRKSSSACRPCSKLTISSGPSTKPSQLSRASCGSPSPRPPFGSSSRFSSTKTAQAARVPRGRPSPRPPFGSCSPRFPPARTSQSSRAPCGSSSSKPAFGSPSLRFSTEQQSRLSHHALDTKRNHGKRSKLNDSTRGVLKSDLEASAVHSPALSHPRCTAAFGSSSPRFGLPSKTCYKASQKDAGPSKLTSVRRNIQEIQCSPDAQENSQQATSRATSTSTSLHIATTGPSTAEVAVDMQSPALTAQVKALEEKLVKVTKDLRKYQDYAGLFALKTKEFQTKYLAECERAEKVEQELTKSNEQRHRLALKLFSSQCA